MRSRNAAFSLVEAIIALAVISLLTGAAVYGLIELNKSAVSQRLQTKARQLCQERIEHILVTPYQPAAHLIGPALGGTWPIPPGPFSESITLPPDSEDQPGIPAQRLTEAVLDDATLQLLRVTVTVRYHFRGRPYSVRMATLRAPD